jgi:hypothetical protein
MVRIKTGAWFSGKKVLDQDSRVLLKSSKNWTLPNGLTHDFCSARAFALCP